MDGKGKKEMRADGGNREKEQDERREAMEVKGKRRRRMNGVGGRR